MTDITKLTITEARKKLDNKEISVKELVEAHIKKSEELKDLNAFITETFDIARNSINQSQEKINKGEAGLLEGIPVGVKDLFCTNDVRTTSGSKILHNFIPKYESTVSQKYKDAGAIMIGKTNMDEMAMGSSNMTSYFGAVKNPWKAKNSNEDLVPGGSSGGSSAAVSAGMVMSALGSDTGGSVRQPAAFCGIVGMKPTYGRCSRFGMIAFASSLDQAGIFARNVADTALNLEAIMGYDPKDSSSVNLEVPALCRNLNSNLKGKKIGIPKEYYNNDLPKEILDLWEQSKNWLRDHGAEIVDITLPHTKYALPVYYIVAPAEASSNLARYDGVRFGHRTEETVNSIAELYGKTRKEGFGSEVKRRILMGTFVLSYSHYDAFFKKAQQLRRLIANDFADAFKNVDAILAPSAPSEAFAINKPMDNPVVMYLNDIFTIPASLAGLPCISVPAGLSANGLPLGMQVIANKFDEQTVLNTALALEECAKFNYHPLG